ncbi:hypothetical protein C0V70_10575 [Bacteriovorax stolpii]|uniref:Uncharacterized protein n=1 Tax=Bacteriovorax stolpii TaxID=960 RepID=A0A2K9NSP0_BACTC|nr:hypothetical protein [Bacteriovorax stolpii]AUN98541.1 hypothetical protein C0V70_10575 [Bacteriovorax stolpii]TDP50831.1 hypothetical protein C8D79_3568 [Bacteriovorax stolpii]
MKKTTLKKWSRVLGMILIPAFFSLTSAQAASVNCVAEKAEFKRLYLELQAKFLNYEGKDTVVDSKGNMLLVPHDPKKEYEGKAFEAAIYQEYQNSLKKVAKLYQAAKFGSDADDIKKGTPGLVDFLKAIDDGDNSAYIQKSKIGDVIDDLYKASNAKFGNSSDKKFALNANDKYLLKKLLTHAQDRLCSVESFEKTGKGTKLFDANYLGQVRNAPLNRLIGALKNAKIGSESELLVDEKTAISSAMSEHLKQLSDWMKKNEACRKAVANPGFIQENIQGCNYNKFLEVLNQQNLDEIQGVLHFINSNERLLNRAQAKAETALDELKLESVIDSTFAGMGNAVSCTKIDGPNNKQRIFVRNLPYRENKFDTSKVVCKLKDKELKSSECSQKIELISDELGRGLELRQKDKTGQNVTFSISGSSSCENLTPSNGVLSSEGSLKTSEMCLAEGKKLTPAMTLVPSEDKKTCVDPATLSPKTPDICLAEGSNKKPAMVLFPSQDKKSCVDPSTLSPKTPEICKAESENKKSKIVLVPSEDKKSCVDPAVLGLKTGEMCQAEGEAMSPKKALIPSTDKKTCVEDPSTSGLKSGEMCKAEGEALNPKKSLIPSEDKKTCIEDPKALKTAEVCKAEGEAMDPKKSLIPSEDKKTCIEDPKADKASGIKTAEACKAEGEAMDPKKVLVPSEDKKSCIEDPKASVLKTEANCSEEGAAMSPPKTLVLSEDKKSCIEDPKASNKKDSSSDEEKKCNDKNDKWIQDSNDGRPGIRYAWDSEKKTCTDRREEKSSRREEKDETPSGPDLSGTPKQAPARFTPVNIPTRQMFILPGMP